MSLRALDLFCGAGGASKGLQNAGFHVTGVDLKASPRYCGDAFVQANALDYAPWWLSRFDFIWASPPCQASTVLKHAHNAKKHLDLIPQTRALLRASGLPYVIENVPGAQLENPFTLCGTMFGLGTKEASLHRHRLFETSFPVVAPTCRHGDGATIGIYGGHVRNRKRAPGKDHQPRSDFAFVDGQEAMGIDWMTLNEMSQAIPPAYSEWIACQFLDQRQAGELPSVA